jgi:hypothetical protein
MAFHGTDPRLFKRTSQKAEDEDLRAPLLGEKATSTGRKRIEMR